MKCINVEVVSRGSDAGKACFKEGQDGPRDIFRSLQDGLSYFEMRSWDI